MNLPIQLVEPNPPFGNSILNDAVWAGKVVHEGAGPCVTSAPNKLELRLIDLNFCRNRKGLNGPNVHLPEVGHILL